MTERGLYSLVLNSVTNSELCHTLAVRHNSLFVTVFKTRELKTALGHMTVIYCF